MYQIGRGGHVEIHGPSQSFKKPFNVHQLIFMGRILI